MNNFTFFTESTLLRLSADPHIQALLCVGTCLLTLVGNMAMILIMKADSQLHTPMCFFLGHLSFLDLSFSSVTVPKMLQNFLSQKKSISVWGCITQEFLFHSLRGDRSQSSLRHGLRPLCCCLPPSSLHCGHEQTSLRCNGVCSMAGGASELTSESSFHPQVTFLWA